MIIKVCGMRDSKNIRAVEAVGIDWMGFIFWDGSPRFVADTLRYLPTRCKRVGLFVNQMPQYIIDCIDYYNLDMVQLHGDETPVLIDNLRRTMEDMMPGLKYIKAINISSAADLEKAKSYQDSADYLIFDTKAEKVGGNGTQFDWHIVDGYDGQLPFLLSGGIGPDDAERVKAFRHPKCIGIDLNSKFETSPAIKNVEAIKTFVNKIKTV